jgi:hypothetical protein
MAADTFVVFAASRYSAFRSPRDSEAGGFSG